MHERDDEGCACIAYALHAHVMSKVQLQVDSMGAMTHLTKSAFEKQHARH